MIYRHRSDNPGHTPPRRRRGRRGPARFAAVRPIAVLPTLLTLANLLCGFGSIFFASRPADANLLLGWTPVTMAAVFIFAGMVFDALDGRVARLTRHTSELGEQLDSMADMVTFGVAPAFMAVQLIGVDTPFLTEANDRLFDRVVVVIACIYVACAALRLARYNLELAGPAATTVTAFTGLPSPGAAGTVASMVLLHQHFLVRRMPMHWSTRLAAVAVVAVMGLVAFAMVSRLRYVHVINRYVRDRVGFGSIAAAVVLLLVLAIHPQGSIATGFIAYALSAPCAAAWRRGLGRRAKPPNPQPRLTSTLQDRTGGAD